MSGHTPLDELLQVIEEGLNRPAFLWQALVLVVALVGGALLARWVRARIEDRLAHLPHSDKHAMDVLQFSIDGVRRLVFPIAVMGLLLAGTATLRLEHQNDERLLRLALLLFVALAAVRFGVYVLRRIWTRSAWLQASERTLAASIWVVMALHLTGALGDVVQWLEHATVPIGRQHVSLWLIGQALMFVALTVIAALWLASVVEARLMRAQHLQRNVQLVLARVVKAVLLVVAVLLALASVGIDLTVLSVFGGALGVGLGLGLQRIASNYVSGFVLLLDRSLRIGDMITVDQFSGAVTQINTRYTVLRALDGTETIVPNEMLMSNAVKNLSFSDRRVLLELKVTVSYDASLDEALEALVRAAQVPKRVLKDPAAGAYVTGFGADGIDLAVLFWIGDPENGRMSVTSEVARAVYDNLRAAGISIPYPQRELRWADRGADDITALVGQGDRRSGP